MFEPPSMVRLLSDALHADVGGENAKERVQTTMKGINEILMLTPVTGVVPTHVDDPLSETK